MRELIFEGQGAYTWTPMRVRERTKKSLIFFIKNLFTSNLFAEAYSEPCQTSKMETFTKVVTG